MAALTIAVAACAQAPVVGAAAASPAASLDSDRAVEDTLLALNAALARRDLAAFMALFDEGDDIVLVGSDVGEVFKGRAAISGFIKQLLELPFVFSFETPQVIVRRNGSTAWAFVDGSMVHTKADGASRKMPYRFALFLVQRGNAWRWQLFDGAVPRPE